MGALFLIALLSFTATIYYSLAGMRQIMSAALVYGDRQGKQLTRDSRIALQRQVNSDLRNTASNQARIAGLLLANIADAVSDVAADLSAGRLYSGADDPSLFQPSDARPEQPERFALLHLPAGLPETKPSKEQLRKFSAAVPFLFDLQKNSPFISSAAIILPSGIQLCHPWRRLAAEYDARGQVWYRQTVAGRGKVCWVKTDDNTVICARAAFDGETLLGVVAAEIPVGRISYQVTRMRSGSLSFLTDSQGKVISGGAIPAPGALRDVEKIVRERKTGVFLLKNDGVALLAAAAPVPDCDWHLVVCQREDRALKSIREMEKMLDDERQIAQTGFERRIYDMAPGYVGISLILLVLILLLGYFLARQLTRPISTLMKNAHSIGNGHLDNKIHLHTGDELEQLANTINQMADDLTGYIRNLNQAARDRQRVESELRTAAEIQESMLPEPVMERPDIDLCAVMKPAREVGGDLYDYVFIDPIHLFFVIGDVSGKGMPAALFMATAKTLMRGFARNALSPAEVLQQTNNYLEEGNDSCMFITVFCGLLDCVTGEVVCCNAGHNPPIRLKADGRTSVLRLPAGFPLGPFPQAKPDFYPEEHLQLEPGETLVFYTDGVTEALNEKQDLFGPDRLERALSASAGRKPLRSLLDSLLEILYGFIGKARQSDDLTVLMIQYKGNGKK